MKATAYKYINEFDVVMVSERDYEWQHSLATKKAEKIPLYAIPEGYKLVPIEPDNKQIQSMVDDVDIDGIV